MKANKLCFFNLIYKNVRLVVSLMLEANTSFERANTNALCMYISYACVQSKCINNYIVEHCPLARLVTLGVCREQWVRFLSCCSACLALSVPVLLSMQVFVSSPASSCSTFRLTHSFGTASYKIHCSVVIALSRSICEMGNGVLQNENVLC